MDSELLLKFIEYFPDYLSALSRTFLHFFGQPLSKQLYTQVVKRKPEKNSGLNGIQTHSSLNIFSGFLFTTA